MTRGTVPMADQEDKTQQDEQSTNTTLKNLDDQTRPTSKALVSDIIYGADRDSMMDQVARRVKALEGQLHITPNIALYSPAAAPSAPIIVSSGDKIGFLPVSDIRAIGYNIYKADTVELVNVAQRVDFISQPPTIISTSPLTFTGETGKVYWVTSVNAAGTESSKILATPRIASGSTYVAPVDAAAPGAVQNFTVTTRETIYVADWTDPLTNVLSLNNFALQWSYDAAFSDPARMGTILLGRANHYEASLGNRTYYFRIAAHNESGDTTTNTDSKLLTFYPDGWGPWTYFGAPDPVRATGTDDTGNPGAGSGFSIITHSDDSRVPIGSMAFRITPPSTNKESIYALEVALGSTSTLHGPYAAQRAAHPTDVLKSGSGVVIVAGDPVINLTVSSPAPPALDRKVFLIYGSGDTDLDGNMIEFGGHGATTITLDTWFTKSGTFNWSIVEPWWTQNNWEHTFWIPQDMITEFSDAVWQTDPVIIFSGVVYAQAYFRNYFGI